MTFPKIKWSTTKDGWWYTIKAEISIGSARYVESRCVHEMESGNTALFACVIERMQNNILDVLGLTAGRQ